jgi:hypothetical protein
MEKKSEYPDLVISTEAGKVAKGELEVIQQELEKYRIYIQSGLLPDYIKKPEQALLIAQMGKELGLKPISAFASIYTVNNKPDLQVSVMQKRLEEAGVWWQTERDYVEQELAIAGGKKFINKVTQITFFRKAPDGTILNETGYFDRKMSTEITINLKGQTLADKEIWKNREKDMIWKTAFRNGARKIANYAFLGFDIEVEAEPEAVSESVLPKPELHD